MISILPIILAKMSMKWNIIIAASFSMYFQTVCMFGKMMSLILFARQNFIYGVAYAVACLCEWFKLDICDLDVFVR